MPDLCQRHYGDGRPCAQQMRYREPLPGAAGSCWRHLNAEERQHIQEQSAAYEKLATEAYMSEGNRYLTWSVPARTAGQKDEKYLHVFQAGRCAWCGRTDQPLRRDHDHDSELLRGLLCEGCNQSEAVYGRYIKRKDIDRPHAWDIYRRMPPAILLGLFVHVRNDPRCRCGCSGRMGPQSVLIPMMTLRPGDRVPGEPLFPCLPHHAWPVLAAGEDQLAPPWGQALP